MQASNLGVVFGPTLMRPEDNTMAAIMDLKFQNLIVQHMIEHFAFFFENATYRESPSEAQARRLSMRSDRSDAMRRAESIRLPRRAATSPTRRGGRVGLPTQGGSVACLPAPAAAGRGNGDGDGSSSDQPADGTSGRGQTPRQGGGGGGGGAAEGTAALLARRPVTGIRDGSVSSAIRGLESPPASPASSPQVKPKPAPRPASSVHALRAAAALACENGADKVRRCSCVHARRPSAAARTPF